MKRRIRSIGLLMMGLCLMAATTAHGEGLRRLSLEEAIRLAQTQSVDAAVALNELKTSYWEYRTYKANLLPELMLTGIAPNYMKQYSTYQESDGSFSFVRNNALEVTGELSATQNIWLTGGKLSFTSSLNYLQQLGADGNSSFMAIPFGLTLSQSIFGVNEIKWQRKIEPVRYKEAKANFVSATEEVTMKTITYYFNYLLACENVGIAEQNHRNAQKMYNVAVAKRKMGQISENELMQMHLLQLNAESTLTDNQSAMKNALFKLRSFLGLDEDVVLELLLPEQVPYIRLDYKDVLEKAQENHSFSLNIRRRQLQAEYEVAKARGGLRDVNLFVSVGYTGKANEFADAYGGLRDNQVVKVGVTMPLLDWGKRKGRVKVAQSNLQVTESRLKQEQMNFSQDIFILVEQFNNQNKQLSIAIEADTIAGKRYRTSIETFMVGSINTLELNDAQMSKDVARRKWIDELYYYWYYYYQLRSITLWDFLQNESIDAEFDKIVNG